LPAFSRIRSEFQSRGIALPHQGARQLRAKPPGLELDVGPLGPAQLLERGRPNHLHAMPVAPLVVQQRGRRLDQPLPDSRGLRVALPNNRTPYGFQGLVGQPIFAVVEQGASAPQDRLTLFGRHLTSDVSRQTTALRSDV